MRRAILIGIWIAALAPSEAGAQSLRADQGQRLFAERCNACHVAPGAGVGADAAPTLVTLAERAQSSDYLRGRLIAPHPPMPDLALTNADIENLVAYFARVRAGR